MARLNKLLSKKVLKNHMFAVLGSVLFFGWPLPREVNSVRRPTKSCHHISQENKFFSNFFVWKFFGKILIISSIFYLFYFKDVNDTPATKLPDKHFSWCQWICRINPFFLATHNTFPFYVWQICQLLCSFC